MELKEIEEKKKECLFAIDALMCDAEFIIKTLPILRDKLLNIKTEDIIYLIETLNDGIKNIKSSGDPLLAFELLILKYCNYDNEKYEIKMIDDKIKEMDCINKEVSTIQEVSSTSNNNQLSIANECLENTDNSKENNVEYDVESESNFLDEIRKKFTN